MLDASLPGDRLCRKARQKLLISYKDHAQRDSYDLVADIQYPNLSFDQTALDFGCVLNDTEKRIMVTATNTSTVPVSYNWVFVEEGMGRPPADPLSPMNATMSSALDVTAASASAPDLPDTVDDALLRADKVFDVLPIHGVIQPGM